MKPSGSPADHEYPPPELPNGGGTVRIPPNAFCVTKLGHFQLHFIFFIGSMPVFHYERSESGYGVVMSI